MAKTFRVRDWAAIAMSIALGVVMAKLIFAPASKSELADATSNEKPIHVENDLRVHYEMPKLVLISATRIDGQPIVDFQIASLSKIGTNRFFARSCESGKIEFVPSREEEVLAVTAKGFEIRVIELVELVVELEGTVVLREANSMYNLKIATDDMDDLSVAIDGGALVRYYRKHPAHSSWRFEFEEDVPSDGYVTILACKGESIFAEVVSERYAFDPVRLELRDDRVNVFNGTRMHPLKVRCKGVEAGVGVLMFRPEGSFFESGHVSRRVLRREIEISEYEPSHFVVYVPIGFGEVALVLSDGRYGSKRLMIEPGENDMEIYVSGSTEFLRYRISESIQRLRSGGELYIASSRVSLQYFGRLASRSRYFDVNSREGLLQVFIESGGVFFAAISQQGDLLFPKVEDPEWYCYVPNGGVYPIIVDNDDRALELGVAESVLQVVFVGDISSEIKDVYIVIRELVVEGQRFGVSTSDSRFNLGGEGSISVPLNSGRYDVRAVVIRYDTERDTNASFDDYSFQIGMQRIVELDKNEIVQVLMYSLSE